MHCNDFKGGKMTPPTMGKKIKGEERAHQRGKNRPKTKLLKDKRLQHTQKKG